MEKQNKFILSLSAALLLGMSANAADISMNTAQMQAMDKITGEVKVIDVPVNSEVIFETFSIVVRECKTHSPEEAPEDFAYVDVADTTFDKTQYNIFKGWMISSSPSLNAVEHPIYDVWLLKCVDKSYNKLVTLSGEQLKLRDALPKRDETAIESSKYKFIPVENAKVTAEPVEEEVSEIDAELEALAKAQEEQNLAPAIKSLDDKAKVKEIVAPSDDGNAPQMLINFGQDDQPVAEPQPAPVSEPEPSYSIDEGDSEVESEPFKLDFFGPEDNVPPPAPVYHNDVDSRVDYEADVEMGKLPN